MINTVMLIAGSCAGLVALAFGLVVMFNRDKPLLGGGIGTIGVIMLMVCGTMAEAEQEITARQYEQVRTWSAVDPAVRPAVAHAMVDDRVDTREFNLIRDAVADDALAAERNGLRQQLNAAHID